MALRINWPAALLSAAILAGGGAWLLRDGFRVAGLSGRGVSSAYAPPVDAVEPFPRFLQGGNGAPVAVPAECAKLAGRAGEGWRIGPPCPARAASPDTRLAVVRNAGEYSPVLLIDARNAILDEIPMSAQNMPFTLFWSPRPGWFFVNEYQGSGQERLRAFEIVNRSVVERSAIYAEAVRTMVARYPCLADHGHVAASGWRWSRDGRRIVLTAYARPDACAGAPGVADGEVGWEPLWMIGDVETGRIDPTSVRVHDGGEAIPDDGPYAGL